MSLSVISIWVSFFAAVVAISTTLYKSWGSQLQELKREIDDSKVRLKRMISNYYRCVEGIGVDSPTKTISDFDWGRDGYRQFREEVSDGIETAFDKWGLSQSHHDEPLSSDSFYHIYNYICSLEDFYNADDSEFTYIVFVKQFSSPKWHQSLQQHFSKCKTLPLDILRLKLKKLLAGLTLIFSVTGLFSSLVLLLTRSSDWACATASSFLLVCFSFVFISIYIYLDLNFITVKITELLPSFFNHYWFKFFAKIIFAILILSVLYFISNSATVCDFFINSNETAMNTVQPIYSSLSRNIKPKSGCMITTTQQITF